MIHHPSCPVRQGKKGPCVCPPSPKPQIPNPLRPKPKR